VLVNNAGYGFYGFFEETNIKDAHEQFATNVFGVFNVTWAVLPVMRSARKGRVFNLSSLGGLIGGQMASFYCATKFARSDESSSRIAKGENLKLNNQKYEQLLSSSHYCLCPDHLRRRHQTKRASTKYQSQAKPSDGERGRQA